MEIKVTVKPDLIGTISTILESNSFEDFDKYAVFYPDNETCRLLLEKTRWGEKPVCPFCGHDKKYDLWGGKMYKCASCRRKYHVLIGTPFENTKIPLNKWFWAIHAYCNKGILSSQLARDLHITQKSAWWIINRIRGNLKPHEIKKRLQLLYKINEDIQDQINEIIL